MSGQLIELSAISQIVKSSPGFELERKCRFAKNFVVRRVYHKYQITLLKTLTTAIFQFPIFCLLGACKSRSGHLQSKPVLSCGLHCNISPQQSNFDDKLKTEVFPSNFKLLFTWWKIFHSHTVVLKRVLYIFGFFNPCWCITTHFIQIAF